jgi:pyrimidine operon attenuation protein / uracil phosphoribosyltransferase
MKKLFSQGQLAELTASLAENIMQLHPDVAGIILIGIQQGGVVVADEIVKKIQALNPGKHIQYGQLDITFYRDDMRKEILVPDKMNLPFDIENKTVILIDDVLFTGRTIKAALDSLLDYGRPAKVELCVLIDRKEHRQLPIQADYTGKSVETKRSDKVKLVKGEVVLISAD